MTPADDLYRILDRILEGNLTDAERVQLRQSLKMGNVNVGHISGGDVQVGDRIYHGADAEAITQAIKEALRAVQQEQVDRSPLKGTDNKSTSQDEQEQFEKLEEVDGRFIKLVNSRLEVVEGLRESGEISEKQIEEFEILKQKVKSVNRLSGRLRELNTRSERLLREVVLSLEEKRQESIRVMEESIRCRTQDANSGEQVEALGNQIEAVGRLLGGLEDGRGSANWLDQNRGQFAKSVGRRALDIHSDIKTFATEKQINNFLLSIEQFLEQISFCLVWGDYSILDLSEIPLVFDASVYQTAFTLVVEMIPRSRHLSDENVSQLEDYIEYLIQRIVQY